jgi:starch synthase
MTGSLKILFVSAECVPFAKTGGLGDVSGALPRYLQRLGHSVIIVMPLYSFIDCHKYNIITAIDTMDVRMGDELISCSVCTTKLPDNVTVYFINYEPFFRRDNIYHDNDYNDYHDNPKRFTFLSKAAMELCHEISYAPDIIHANDWHTAILTAYLRRLYLNDPLFTTSASVLTIHNLAYQGRYDRYFFHYAGLNENDFTPDKFECHYAVNLLKGGIYFADMVNTVSRGYAAETRTPEGGFGLDQSLNIKKDHYIGIINGVDYSEWDPAKDPLIPANYSYVDLKGKYECKKVLQEKSGFRHDSSVALIGIIGRLVVQKGFYLLSQCIEDIIKDLDVQIVMLGSGDTQLERFYSGLQQHYPGKFSVTVGYDNDFAHLIEAGSDFFLMPSLSEPCGLNQIYSLKYGTLPIVRATGGLSDTVDNYNQETCEGTGFKFWEPSGKAIYNTVKWALDTYYNRKPHLQKLINNAMAQNFSWDKSAGEYIKMYHRALSDHVQVTHWSYH